MKARFPCFVVALMFAAAAGPAVAQRSLEEVESRLEELPPGAEAPAAGGGWLGLTANETAGGVVVETVADGGPAATAGIRPGDLIVAASGAEIGGFDDLAAAVGAKTAGERLEVDFLRSGRRYRVEVRLAGPPVERTGRPPAGSTMRDVPPAASPPPGSTPPPPHIPPPPGGPKLGVVVGAITPELRAAYRLAVRSGALVKAVHPGSPAAAAEIPVGAAIVALNGRRVDGPTELTLMVTTLRFGQEIELTYFVGERLVKQRLAMDAATPFSAPPGPPGLPPGPPPAGEALPGAGPPRGAPGPRLPALDELERRLEPPVEDVPPPAGPPAADDPAELRREIESARAELDAVQRHLRDLEQRLEEAEK